MAFRLSPHILSVINWNDPLNDPIRRQFLPLKSSMNVTHLDCSLDSVQESDSSPVPGLVHRYPNKALSLSESLRRPAVEACWFNNTHQHPSVQFIAASVSDPTVYAPIQRRSRRCGSYLFSNNGSLASRTSSRAPNCTTLCSRVGTHTYQSPIRSTFTASVCSLSRISSAAASLPRVLEYHRAGSSTLMTAEYQRS